MNDGVRVACPAHYLKPLAGPPWTLRLDCPEKWCKEYIVTRTQTCGIADGMHIKDVVIANAADTHVVLPTACGDKALQILWSNDGTAYESP